MKRIAVITSLIFLTGSLALSQPTTAPSMPLTKVLIVPFKQVGDTTNNGWVGSAIQEDLTSNVAALGTTEAVTLNHPLANADKQDVLSAAKSVNASVAVFGSYQTSNHELRITGQAVDVDSGRVLASLQATGPTTDLFKMEDTLGAELTGVLPQPPSNTPEVTYGQGQNVPPPQNPNAAQPYASPDVQQPYAPNPYYNNYDYGYSYPYYPYYGYAYPSVGWGWGYPYWGVGWGWGGWGRGSYRGWGGRGFGGRGFVGHGFVGGGHFGGGGHGGGGHR